MSHGQRSVSPHTMSTDESATSRSSASNCESDVIGPAELDFAHEAGDLVVGADVEVGVEVGRVALAAGLGASRFLVRQRVDRHQHEHAVLVSFRKSRRLTGNVVGRLPRVRCRHRRGSSRAAFAGRRGLNGLDDSAVRAAAVVVHCAR